VNRFECGWAVKPEAQAIRDLVLKLDRTEVIRAKSGCSGCAEECNWDKERLKLTHIYRALWLVDNSSIRN